MRKFRKMVSLDLLNLVKKPAWLFYGLFFPFVLTAVMGTLATAAYGEDVTSYDYYGITMMLYSVLNAATFAANALLEERVKRPNLRLLYAPIHDFLIPLSKIVATWLFTCVFYTISGILMYGVFHVNFGGENLGYVWCVFALCDFIAAVFGVIMCLIFKSEGVANQFTGIFLALLCGLSGVFFPIASLGEKVQKLSQWIPLKKVIHLLFQLVYEQQLGDFASVMMVMLGVAVTGCVICMLSFKGENFI